MRDILPDLIRWRMEGRPIALATVVQTWGSSPRRVGAKMAITSDGKFTGSVSGGCVENAVIEAALMTLKRSEAQLLHFGVTNETAWGVGLACGGSIDILVTPLEAGFFDILNAALTDEIPVVVATVTRGPGEMLGRAVLLAGDTVTGRIGNEWNDAVLEQARDALRAGVPMRAALSDSVELFLDVILPPSTLVVVGGVHIAMALVSVAKTLGYRTVVIDPRRAWGSAERFPNVDSLLQSWPDKALEEIKVTPSTAIAVLTHDPKVDDPALKYSLASDAFYVGVLGSRSTHARRRARLLADGVPESQLARLHAPIGLSIGAETPEEIALAIMAEVVEAYRKRDQDPARREADLHPAV